MVRFCINFEGKAHSLRINFTWVMREGKESKMIQSEQLEGIRIVTC